MAEPLEPILGGHQLEMDGDWALTDLSGFGRQYSHLYVVLYSLQFHVPEVLRETDRQSEFGWVGVRHRSSVRQAW